MHVWLIHKRPYVSPQVNNPEGDISSVFATWSQEEEGKEDVVTI